MTEYPMVVNKLDLIPDLLGILAHLALVLMQGGLALYLGLSGARRLGSADTRAFGALRLALAGLLVLPLLAGSRFVGGTHFAFSLLACGAALALLGFMERETRGQGRIRRFARGAAIGAALLVGAYGLWEREDPLALGAEILTTARDWRAAELEWQRKADATAPKLGELAPDFELQDPEGATAVRLADYRGKRPVALIFGSYT